MGLQSVILELLEKGEGNWLKAEFPDLFSETIAHPNIGMLHWGAEASGLNTKGTGEGHKDILEVLSPKRVTLLMAAIEHGCESTFAALWRIPALRNQVDVMGYSALHYAALYDRMSMYARISRVLSPAEQKDKWGRTALHLAAAKNHHTIVALILAESPELCAARDNMHNVPLDYAIRGGNLEAFHLLCDGGRRRLIGNYSASMCSLLKTGQVIIPTLIVGTYGMKTKRGHWLQADDAGLTPWRCAVEAGSPEILTQLRSIGLDPWASEGTQTYPADGLRFAFEYHHKEVLRWYRDDDPHAFARFASVYLLRHFAFRHQYDAEYVFTLLEILMPRASDFKRVRWLKSNLWIKLPGRFFVDLIAKMPLTYHLLAREGMNCRAFLLWDNGVSERFDNYVCRYGFTIPPDDRSIALLFQDKPRLHWFNAEPKSLSSFIHTIPKSHRVVRQDGQATLNVRYALWKLAERYIASCFRHVWLQSEIEQFLALVDLAETEPACLDPEVRLRSESVEAEPIRATSAPDLTPRTPYFTPEEEV